MGKNIYIIFSKSINYFVEKIKKTITFKEYNYKYRHKWYVCTYTYLCMYMYMHSYSFHYIFIIFVFEQLSMSNICKYY